MGLPGAPWRVRKAVTSRPMALGIELEATSEAPSYGHVGGDRQDVYGLQPLEVAEPRLVLGDRGAVPIPERRLVPVVEVDPGAAGPLFVLPDRLRDRDRLLLGAVSVDQLVLGLGVAAEAVAGRVVD